MPPKTKPRVLVCPLDWGLGHATRCIPIIRELLAQGANVILGTTGLQSAFFSQELPELVQVHAPSYQIQYPRHGWQMPFWLFHEMPRMRRLVQEEQCWTEQICREQNIDLIISDNRFGCYSKVIPSIYITHQLRIPFATPFQKFEVAGQKLHAHFQKPFSEVWIPDTSEKPGLAGRMSHSGLIPGKHVFVGPLTRFSPSNPSAMKKYQWMAMLSGPEPQRSIMEDTVLKAFSQLPGNKLVVQGKPGVKSAAHGIPNLVMYSHLNSSDLQNAILSSEIIVCRSGYSSLMDLQVLQAKAILIPTPGQTEQEYLAKILRRARICGAMTQSRINAHSLQIESTRASGFPRFTATQSVLSQAVESALRRCQ